MFQNVNKNGFECVYHPGRIKIVQSVLQLDSFYYRWTCCGRGWDKAGCREGEHSCVFKELAKYRCCNHGQLNPVSKQPNSLCRAKLDGKLFDLLVNGVPNDKLECNIHKGYYHRNVWSCCGQSERNAEPCHKTTHSIAMWPDPRAIYEFIGGKNGHQQLSGGGLP